MDFFERQETARRRTGGLVLLFAVAVLSIIAVAYLLVAALLLSFGDPASRDWNVYLDARMIAAVGGGTLLLVGIGSLVRIIELRAGGASVAEGLGGRLLYADSASPNERRLLNVVEEMAIASGTPAPPVYLLDQENAINAFAAGYSPSDAVIGVSRGCVDRLDRAELQGVIGHEFSHILNGDMRLNIRLIGVLHGILVLGILGTYVLRAGAWSGHGMRRSDRGGSALPLLAVGLGLMAVGSLGTFFGKLIKAAVSRQREFLADAASVQFTRNPKGLSGALQKIGSLKRGSRIDSPRAAEASHMFFGAAIAQGLTGLLATHPPLPERILRIDPGWDGTFLAFAEPPHPPAPPHPRSTPAAAAATGAMGLAAPAAIMALDPRRVAARVGRPTVVDLDHAAAVLQRIPEKLRTAAREPYGARAVVYALLIDPDPEVRRRQLAILVAQADPGVRAATDDLLAPAAELGAGDRLPLVDIAIPSLRGLSPRQAQAFSRNIQALVDADERVELMEWTLQRIVRRHLAPQLGQVRRTSRLLDDIEPVRDACAVLLSTLTYAGHRTADTARAAFEEAARHLRLPDLQPCSIEACSLTALDGALDRLDRLAPLPRRHVIEACAACVAADRIVTIVEGELLRAIADSLGCPIPALGV